MRRLDALRPRRSALRHVRGAVLARELDPPLQAIVERAAAALGAPMAMVSLVLERVQLFRAQVGLPPDLAATCATDRDASFCQIVVRDEAPLAVTDAPHDARVPQALVEAYGVRAYLGAPLRLGGEVIGSLCVLDLVPRGFSDADLAALTALAAEASQRLDALAHDSGDDLAILHERAVQPLFAELKNLLQPLIGNFAIMRIAAAEMGVVQRLLGYMLENHTTPPAAAVLTRVSAALEDLHGAIADAESATGDLQRGVLALEQASTDIARARVAEVISAATTLAHHHSKLVQGVAWRGADLPTALDVARPLAVSTLAAAIAAVAAELYERRVQGGIQGSVEAAPGEVLIALSAAALGDAWAEAVAGPLGGLVGDRRGIRVHATPARLELRFAALA